MRNPSEGLTVAPIKVAGLVTLCVFLVLAGRLFYLQIIKGSHFSGLSERNYIVQVSVKAPRGDIVDRDGQVLAGSRQAFSICGVPRLLVHNRDEVRALGDILGLDEAEVRDRLKASSMSFRPTAVARDVDFATVSRVEESFADLPDVMVIAEPVRYYPEGLYCAHLVGYVAEATRQDIDASGGAIAAGDLVGKAGIEKVYDDYLAGRDGVKFMKFSVGGGTGPADVVDLPERSPRRGMRAVLYADAGLQRLAETLLIGERGSVTALDVKTGGVLALASSPAYDPSLFVAGISSADWGALVDNEDLPLLNRAIQCSYPPGSTYKLITASAGLESGVIGEGTTMRACVGYYQYGNRAFACWNKGGHGTRSLVGAMAVSCDVYFYQVGERLGLDRFSDCSNRWHMGERTGIDLPAESKGLVPSRSYYDSKFGRNKWPKGLIINLAIGQGEILMTPIEMATFVSGIANWGRYYPPACLARIESEGGSYVPQRKPVTLDMSRTTLDLVRRSMLAVCESGEGTGRGARLEGIEVAGKTGTAQNPHGDDHAWFVCFAPYDDPQIAISVMLENAGHGGSVGAPIARRIMEHYFGLDVEEEAPDSTAGVEEVAGLN